MKKLFLLTFIVFAISGFRSYAQLIPITLPKSHGALYLMGGYNRCWFAKSDLTLRGDNYDFTLINAKADDAWKLYEPQDWQKHFPQFSFTLGYQFKGESKAGFEFNYDYVNYTIRNGQTVHLNGQVNDELIDKDTVISHDNFLFRQSNGSGYLSLYFVKAFELLYSSHDAHILQAVIKAGGGMAVSHSNVKIFNGEQTNDYKLNSYLVGGSFVLRYLFCTRIVLDAGVKGAYINYFKINTVNGGEASQIVMPFQATASIGYRFSL